MITKKQWIEYFSYLDDLRESGETNMFGAGEYLIDQFEMNKSMARRVLADWMHTFSDEPVEQRVEKIQETL